LKKLTSENHEEVLAFLKKKPAENLFILWGIEADGYESDRQTFWGQWDQDGKLIGILYKFKNKYTPYWESEFCDIEKFAEVINQDENEKEVIGIESVTAALEKYLTRGYSKRNSYYYAKCEPVKKVQSSNKVRQLTEEEVPRLISLYQKVPEFKREYNEESFKEQMNRGWSRIYVIEKDSEFISSASTVCETNYSAMVSGVCTLPSLIGGGLASICMEHLMEDVFKQNKILCLFYDNPEAGRIYKRLGFEDIEKWTINHC
jgi:predicted GNAT family acetyltransferase